QAAQQQKAAAAVKPTAPAAPVAPVKPVAGGYTGGDEEGSLRVQDIIPTAVALAKRSEQAAADYLEDIRLQRGLTAAQMEQIYAQLNLV
ncbi:MAG: hypothetical protein IKC76_06150, partial [Firmicutes bacterium]|nr:hypothetical protein [Bacillota bacterium]